MEASQQTEQNEPGATAQSPTGGQVGDFVSALGQGVRDNPVSAALIGMGVLWLFAGGSNTSLFGGAGRTSIFRTPRSGAGAAEFVRQTAGHAVSSISSAASQTAGAVQGTTARLAGAGGRVATTVGEVAVQGADKLVAGAATARDELLESGRSLRSGLQRSLTDVFETQPLLLGAVGLGVGAAMAATIPTTEAESAIMGEASDRARDALSEAAAQAAETARSVLREA
jgi:hypothetical protein